MKTKPIHEIRLRYVKAAVWKHDTDNGMRYSVTFCRMYKEGEKWKFTNGFGREDLLALAKVADLTHSWIYTQTKNGASGEQESAPPEQTASA